MREGVVTEARRRAWWTRRRLGAGLVLLASLGACRLDVYGHGSGDDAMPGGEDDTSSSGQAELEGSTGVGSGQADGDTTEPGPDETSSSSGPSGDDATTGPYVDPCESPAPFTVEITVMDAMLAGPMQIGMSDTEGHYAYSEVAGQGRASFELQLPCPAEVRAWARVYDPGVGLSAIDWSDPDSFRVAFDGEDDIAWWYGCQMADVAIAGSAWGWEPVLDNDWCDGGELRRMLSAGTHLLHLTNLEPGNHASASMAAVARVVVTSDPAYVPPS